MSPEAQRIKIAESLGWKPHGPYGDEDDEPPDFLNDLNSMHEAEKAISKHHLNEMGDELRKICFPIFHADATQRAEAYLRTLGLWEDKE